MAEYAKSVLIYSPVVNSRVHTLEFNSVHFNVFFVSFYTQTSQYIVNEIYSVCAREWMSF